jgi:hypothetical protein
MGAFPDCRRLIAISVDASNPFYTSLDGVLFNKSLTTLFQCPVGKTGTYVILDTVTTLGEYAFGGCTGVTSITIGNRVTSIGGSAFRDTRLTSILIPHSVTNIGPRVFDYCSSLKAITVDASNSFYTSVDGVLFSKDQTILVQYPGHHAENYTIPSSATSIGDWAFYSITSLTNVTIPNSIAKIGAYAFCSCGNLTRVYFEGNAPKVDASAFSSAYQATIYYLPGTKGWGPTFGGRPTAVWKR